MRNVLAASWFRFTSLNCLFWQIEHLAWRNTSLIGSPSKWINDDFNHFYLSFSTVFCGSCISAFLRLPVSLLDFLFCARALVTTWLWSGKEKKNHDLAWNPFFVATITDGEGPTSRRRKKKRRFWRHKNGWKRPQGLLFKDIAWCDSNVSRNNTATFGSDVKL